MENEIKTNEENKTDQQKNWIQEELAQQQNSFDGVVLESFKPVENKTETIQVDISSPWNKWEDGEGTIKKIIPVLHDGIEKKFWLNTKNPIFKKMLELAAKAQAENKKAFVAKIIRTGQMQNTRYAIVD